MPMFSVYRRKTLSIILLATFAIALAFAPSRAGATTPANNAIFSDDARKPGETKTVTIAKRVTMVFSWIPKGNFMMGSTEAQVDQARNECEKNYRSFFDRRQFCAREWFAAESPQRRITISNGFWLGKYEVTQGQWQSVMGNNPSNFSDCGPKCPVEQVSWNDAKEFIARLNAKNDGFLYSLPTEAEWEYAARAGTTTAFAFGDSPSSKQANFDGDHPYGSAAKGPFLGKTAKVGSYKPNAWGLYDMHGNVCEWVEDWYTDSYAGLPTDGSANLIVGKMKGRVLRGGSWDDVGNDLRSAVRLADAPTQQSNYNGFRVVARLR